MSITKDFSGGERAMVKPRKSRKTRVRRPDIALQRAGEIFRRTLAGQDPTEIMSIYKIGRRSLQRIIKSIPEETKEHIRRARNRGYVA